MLPQSARVDLPRKLSQQQLGPCAPQTLPHSRSPRLGSPQSQVPLRKHAARS